MKRRMKRVKEMNMELKRSMEMRNMAKKRRSRPHKLSHKVQLRAKSTRIWNTASRYSANSRKKIRNST